MPVIESIQGGAPLREIPREYRRIVKRALQQGWTIRDKSEGWMLHSPTGGRVMLHRTPGRGRALWNWQAQMKKAGYEK